MSIVVNVFHELPSLTLDAKFTISEPGVTALFGPSGSGKTSLINIISGLVRPQNGHIQISDRVLFDHARNINLPARKRQVGYVFQDSRLFPHKNVKSNLFFGARRNPRKLQAKHQDAIIEMLGLGDLLNRMPNKLSGGEKQRVALGRALLANPDILLLDEPLAALDQGRKEEILPYLERLRDQRQCPIIYVSHAIDEVARLADNLVVMERGQSLASGTVSEVLARDDLPSLTGRFDTGVVLNATVKSRDPKAQVSFLKCAGQRLVVPYLGQQIESPVRLHVRARDVMIAMTPPRDISANNILPATIIKIRQGDGDTVDVTMRLGHDHADTHDADTHDNADMTAANDAAPALLQARITAWSASRLQLHENQPVHAIIKSVTVNGKLTR
ncbi:molybdenum ABC transporter ATP-binding protein [Thalassospira sp. MA62]|nr:molybdenum ABC transporter ATP-binding protein [Thalassospira sp. MA62]